MHSVGVFFPRNCVPEGKKDCQPERALCPPAMTRGTITVRMAWNERESERVGGGPTLSSLYYYYHHPCREAPRRLAGSWTVGRFLFRKVAAKVDGKPLAASFFRLCLAVLQSVEISELRGYGTKQAARVRLFVSTRGGRHKKETTRPDEQASRQAG